MCLCGSGSIPEFSARAGTPRYLSLCCSEVIESTGVGGLAGIALLSGAQPITQIRTDDAQKAETVLLQLVIEVYIYIYIYSVKFDIPKTVLNAYE